MSGAARRVTEILATVAAAGALAGGCGGGSSDRTAKPDQQLQQARWIRAVDNACAQTERRVAQRGRPASMQALPGVIAGAADDVREGVRAIRAVRVPSHLRERLQGFDRAVSRLDPMLAALEQAARRGDTRMLEDAADVLDGDLEVLRSSASGVGLKTCARPAGARAAFEALDALFFIAEISALDHRMQRRLRAIDRSHPTTIDEATALYRRLGGLVGQWIRGWDRLHMPQSARREARGYRRVLVAERALCASVAGELGRMSVATPAYAAGVKARFTRLQRRERKAFGAVRRAVRAAAKPVTPDPPDGETPDEPAPA
jgi:hypothetical protein